MFILIGSHLKSRPVPGGRRGTMLCRQCGHETEFMEHETQENLRLYLIDVVGYGAKRVMRCRDCGGAVVTKDIDQTAAKIDQAGTLAGHVSDVVNEGRRLMASEQVQAATRDATEGAKVLATKVGDAAREMLDDDRVKQGTAAVRRWFGKKA